MKRKQAEAKTRYTEFSHVPHLIQIYGKRRVVFESCKRITSFSQEEVALEGQGRVKIRGKDLQLRELGNGNLAVDGKIQHIEFDA